MEKYQDAVILNGLPYKGASVQINAAAGGAATIYSNNTGTVAANPLTTDANGHYQFYAADGRYNAVISGLGFTTYTVGDFLLYDAAASTGAAGVGFIQSGTGAVATDLQTRGRQIVYVTDYAANGVSGARVDPTGATRSDLGIQAAHDYLAGLAQGGILVVPFGTYLCNAGLTWNAAKVSLSAFGAQFDFSAQTTGSGITVSNGGRAIDFGGLKLLGNSSAGSVIGLNISASSGATAAREVMVRNVLVTTFGTGVQFGNNTFTIHFIGCRITSCTKHVDFQGTTNAGENITFTNCSLDATVNGATILNFGASATAYDVYLNHCSLDAGTATGVIWCTLTNSNLVVATDCHIEANDFTVTPITIVGTTSSFIMKGGRITSNQVTITAQNFVTIDGTVQNAGGGARFIGVHLNFGNTASGNFAGGTGSENCHHTACVGGPFAYNTDQRWAWTPTDQSGAALTFTSPSGLATRHDQQAEFDAEITWPATASGAAATLGGLPWNSIGSGQANPIKGSIVYTDYTTAPITLVGGTASKIFALYTTGNVAVTNANLSGKTIRLSGKYLTAT